MLLLLLFVITAFIFFRLWSVLGEGGDDFPQKKQRGPLIHLEEHEITIKKEPLERDIFYEGFEVSSFLKGAEKAFETILKAYHDHNNDLLKKLLSPAFFKELSQKAHREKLETFRLISASIAQKIKEGTKAHITVHFVSYQVLSNYRGEVDDFWTFERDIQNTSPNWFLVNIEDKKTG